MSEDLERLERSVNRLALVCQSMWEIIRDETTFTEEDLERKVLEVDLRDGRADGKIGGQVLVCASCGKNTNSQRPTCIICGVPVKRPHQFEG